MELLPNEENKKANSYPSMSYWGGVIDNIHKVLEYGDIHEITMIESLLKTGLDLLLNRKEQNTQMKSIEQHISVRNNKIEADNINIGITSKKRN